MGDIPKDTIEIRGFLQLDAIFFKKHGKRPLVYPLTQPITGKALATALEIPLESIEVIFINGFVHAVDAIIHPGDRVAFLPPGCPGPYRIALGFYSKNQDNASNFKLKK